jgi:hypothetical protein
MFGVVSCPRLGRRERMIGLMIAAIAVLPP